MTTFECTNCHQVFTKARSDEEAELEYASAMPEAFLRGDEQVLVCSGCYAKIMEWAQRIGLAL